MSEIKIGNTKYTDTMNKIHKDSKGIICCGKPIRMVFHADGRDFYRYGYNCECGNIITADTKRKKGRYMGEE